MRRLFVLIPLLFAALLLPAQDKKLTLEDVVLRQRTTLAPQRLPQLQWIPGTAFYAYVQTGGGEETLMKSSAAGTPAPVLTLQALNALLREAKADTVARFPALKWKDAQTVTFGTGAKQWRLSLADRRLSDASTPALPEQSEVPETSADGKTAWVQDHNIWLELPGGRRQITRDGSAALVYGKSVHREEFGIEKGLFWSDKGNRLAFYRMDQSMVTDYPLVDFTTQPAKENPVKYPMAGAKSHEVTVGIYDVAAGTVVYLQTGTPADHYLTNICWSPDERFVYLALADRSQDHFSFNQYDAATGALVKTLFEERDNKYAEPLHPAVFVTGKPTQFIWQSRRDGWNHLYLYHTDGTLIRQLTRGETEVTDFNGFDQKGTKAFFHATANTGLNREFRSVDLATGKVTLLAGEDGVHNCQLSDNRTYFIDTYSSLTLPRAIRIRQASDGKVVRELLKAEHPLKGYAAGSTRVFPLKAEDGTPLWCRMILPAGFDSTKKYPVICYVYGGPHVQLITNAWLAGADLWLHYLTQQGYIVFTLDNRGSAYRGKTFEQATFRNLGEVEMKDQITGVNYLRKLPYVDANRLGINGWSFGGFMTTSLMTRYPGIFKVAVAGGPVIDWSYYEVMYTERYMDTPDENPAGYKLSNLLNYLEQLNGKLMLIHGTADDVVVWQHSLMYLKKAISKGVQLDYFVYPGHPHNVQGRDRMHLQDKITRYFNDYLK